MKQVKRTHGWWLSYLLGIPSIRYVWSIPLRLYGGYRKMLKLVLYNRICFWSSLHRRGTKNEFSRVLLRLLTIILFWSKSMMGTRGLFFILLIKKVSVLRFIVFRWIWWKSDVERLGGKIGKVLEIDFDPWRPRWGDSLTVWVDFDVTKPLRRFITVNKGGDKEDV